MEMLALLRIFEELYSGEQGMIIAFPMKCLGLLVKCGYSGQKWRKM